MLRKTGIAAIALGTSMLLGAAAPALARDRDDKCEQRIHKAEEKLRKEVSRHGEGSRQAQQRRRDLEEAQRSCHPDRGHDDHDHDHDNEHHDH